MQKGISLEEIDVLHDVDEEKKQQRYLALIGHTDEYLYWDNWTPAQRAIVRRQNIETNRFGFLTEQEQALHLIESNHFFYTYDEKTKMCKIPYIVIGEPCSICMEPFLSRKNAYFTECGHKIHKTCITNYYNSTYNNKALGHSHNWKIRCPICRCPLTKCLWLEKRYLTNPYLKKAVKWNLDYECYPEYFNHDIMECAGCECTNGCGNVCGSKHNTGCLHCERWRSFTYNDLVYHNQQCVHYVNLPTFSTKKKNRICGLWSWVWTMFASNIIAMHRQPQ